MRELKATDKITQKMTRDGAVSENLATGEVEHISSREPETELSASSEESAGAAADLALRAAEHHEKKSARKAEKADTQAVRDGSAARQRPSSRLQFTEEERADPALGKYIDRSDRAADKLDAAKAAIPTKKVLRIERVFDETVGKGKTQLHFEEVEKRPNGRLRHNPLSRPVHEIVHAAHAKVHEVEQENVGVEAGHKGEVLTESPWQQVTEADVRAEVAHWLTLHEQEVPAYSAAKHEGQSLYKLARKGKEVPKKVKSMEISQADVLEVELPFVRFRVACSSGTYIRSLAHSLGMRLGCGAVLTELTREYSHPFGLEVACGLDELSADPGLLVKHLRPLAEALPHWPVLELDEAAEARIRNGMAIPCRDDVGDKALLQRQGMPLALARRSETPQGPCWTVLRGLWN